MSRTERTSKTHLEYRGPVFVQDGPPSTSLGRDYHASVEHLVERCILRGRPLPADEDVHQCDVLGAPSPEARDVLATSLRDNEAPEELADNADGRRMAALQGFLDDWFETCGVSYWRERENAYVVLLPNLRDYVASVLSARAAGDPRSPYDLRPFFPRQYDLAPRAPVRERAGFYAHVDLVGRRDLGVCFVREVRRAGADMWLIQPALGGESLQCGLGVFRMEMLDSEQGYRLMSEVQAAAREAGDRERRLRAALSLRIAEHDVEVVDYGDLLLAQLSAMKGLPPSEYRDLFPRLLGRDGIDRVAAAIPHCSPRGVSAHEHLTVNLSGLGASEGAEAAQALRAALSVLGFRCVTVRQPTDEERASYNDIPF